LASSRNRRGQREKVKKNKIKIKEEREKTGRTQRKETTQDYKGHG
jgi:hypothetical protein